MKKLKKKLLKFFNEIVTEVKRHSKDKFSNFIFINIVLIVFQFLYILLRKEYLSPEIPLWYTRTWGEFQLASKNYIIVLPILSSFLLIVSSVLIALLNKYFVRYITEVLTFLTTACNILLTIQLFRIFSIATLPYKPIINPLYLSLVPYFLISFVAINALIPKFIIFMHSLGIVTNPGIHQHPGMLLKGPSARGGGVLFTLLFIILSVLITGFSSNLLGFYISLSLLALLSFVDDYQNTHPYSTFRLIENPIIRLLLLTSLVSVVVLSGIKFDVILNPLQNFVNGQFINFTSMELVSGVVTVVWIVWFMNVLSWSNGIDGQYSGIVGIAFIMVAILSLRFEDLESTHQKLAILATLSAGLSFGMVKQTWYPSKMMWGFGAMSAGLILAVLSLLSQSKIITSVIIVLIPFLDAVVTLFRRLFQGKNPLKGDSGHLHHLLLKKGWSVSKIALFYWLTTAVFGLIGLLTAERFTLQVGLIMVGVVAFGIVLLNLKSLTKKDENTIPRG